MDQRRANLTNFSVEMVQGILAVLQKIRTVFVCEAVLHFAGRCKQSVRVRPVPKEYNGRTGASMRNTIRFLLSFCCVVIDGATNATTTVNVGRGPTLAAVNPVTNKIYVSNSESGSVTVIDGGIASAVTPAVESRKGAGPGPTGSRLFPFPAHQTGQARFEHPAFRQISPQAHGSRPRCTSRNRSTPNFPNTTASEKMVKPREEIL